MASITNAKPLDFAVQQINTLKALRKSSIITDEDYTYRRDQIIDGLTVDGSLTTSAFSYDVSSPRGYSKSVGCSPLSEWRQSTPNSVEEPRYLSLYSDQDSLSTQIKKHPPPDWNDNDYPLENATKITYNFDAKTWDRKDIKVRIDTEAFDRGGLRLVFHLRDTSDLETAFVAKLSIDNAVRTVYFDDVRMQSVAAYFARKYNSYNPPKLVEFISAYVLELKQREGEPVCGVEKFIAGHYRKYNNNNGWMSEDHRNTPAAFCHFSYVASQKELLICDIQGVGDVYTDPQIHSKDGKGYGKGNLGREGIASFLSTHQCNRICEFLGLPNIRGLPVLNDGTLPTKSLMIKRELTPLSTNFDQGHSPIRLLMYPQVHQDEEKDSACKCCML